MKKFQVDADHCFGASSELLDDVDQWSIQPLYKWLCRNVGRRVSDDGGLVMAGDGWMVGMQYRKNGCYYYVEFTRMISDRLLVEFVMRFC